VSSDPEETQHGAAEELPGARERLEAVLASAFDGIVTMGSDSVILTANPAAHELFGYRDGELVGCRVEQLIPDPHRDAHESYVRRFLDTGERRIIGGRRELEGVRRDGSRFELELAVNVTRVGDEVLFVGLLRDLSERQDAKRRVFATNTLLSAIAQNIQEGILLETPARRVAMVNAQLCALLGLDVDPEALAGESVSDTFARSDEAADFAAGTDEIVAAGVQVRGEALPLRGGRTLERDYLPMQDGGHLWQARDVTQQRAATEALRTSEARKTAMLETALDCIVVMDQDGLIVDFNPAAEQTFGHAREHAIGSNLAELIIPERFRDAHAAGLAKYLATGEGPALDQRLQLPAQRADGSEFPAELAIHAIEVEDRAFFTAYLRDVTQRVQAEEALTAARDEAQRASRAKSEFLANMSHEIRTPMTAILGYADMVAGRGAGNVDPRVAARRIRRNADHLLSLLNDVLDFSKIEAGQFRVAVASCSLHEILSDVVSLLRSAAAAKGLDVHTHVDTPLPERIESDPVRVRQILHNVAGNAVRFTDEGHVALRVRWESEPSELVVVVEDSGIGIEPGRLEEIFESFAQVHERDPDRPGGTGLGLTISRRLANALGGELTAESEVGAGSRFTLRLPLALVEGTGWVDDHAAFDLAAEEQPAAGAGVLGGGRSVLVVDDNPDNRRIVTHLLETVGATVTCAISGVEALALVADAAHRDRPFDLILMDMQMPEMDGYAATRRLREQGVRTPIVAVTAFAMAGDEQRCLDAGCDAYLSKPIVAESLQACVAGVLPEASPDVELPPPPDAALVERLGNPRFRTIFESFLEDLEKAGVELRSALVAHEHDVLQRVAHRLHGTAGSFGLDDVTEHARSLENELRSGSTDVAHLVAALADTIDAAHARSLAALRGTTPPDQRGSQTSG
jgi:PAS domain S-box-containing protein